MIFFGESVICSGVHRADELVQRRVEQADGGGAAFEGLEDADEVLLLVREGVS